MLVLVIESSNLFRLFNLCFFQQDPRKLVKIRSYLKRNSEKFGNILTLAIYRHHAKEMLIYSEIRKYDIIMKS